MVAQASCPPQDGLAAASLWGWRASRLPATIPRHRAGCPGVPTGTVPVLHNAFAQRSVFTREQILRELITAFVRVAVRAGKVMIDS